MTSMEVTSNLFFTDCTTMQLLLAQNSTAVRGGLHQDCRIGTKPVNNYEYNEKY